MTEPAALLRALAVPRLTGSDTHAAVRELLKTELRARGLTVDEHAFEATDGPLRRAAGSGELAALAALAFAIGALAGEPIMGAWIAAIALLALVGVALVSPRVVRRAPGVNLLGRRGSQIPRVWLTAHYDSKGQRLSMAVRLGAVLALGVQAPLLVALVALMAGGCRGAWLAALVVPALVGGVLLSRADLRNDSPGAVDNATGVLAVLMVLDRLPAATDVGVVLTDAEEWGLQGARALVGEQPDLFRDASVVNFDGLDDRGVTVVLAHRPGPLTRKLAGAVGARRLHWLPVLVDGMAFARASRECLTVMRGGWGTMRRVHTRHDTPSRLALDGVGLAAAAVADAVVGA